jgi:hypothetical protein
MWSLIMDTRNHTLLLAAILLILASIQATAETRISYQGQLDQSGNPYTGSADMRFQLYDAATGGNAVGPEINRAGVQVTDGLFQVELDFGATAFETSPLWLQVKVDGVDLTPRQRLGAAPYAINAANAGIETLLAGFGLIGGGSGDSVNLSVDSSLFQRRVTSSCNFGSAIRSISASGGVTCEVVDTGALSLPFSGSASTSPTSTEVFEITNNGSGRAIVGRSSYEGSATWVPAIYGVHESSTGPGDGIQGTTETTFNGSAGVRGRAQGTSGEVYGVYGFGRSPDGFAGYFTNISGAAVLARGDGVDSQSGQIYADLHVDRGNLFTPSGQYNLIVDGESLVHPIFQVQNQGFGFDGDPVYFSLLELFASGNLTIDGSLTQNSDRAAKHDIAAVEPETVLARIAELPIAHWRYNDDPDTLHMGPMAQDFHAAFGLGDDPTGINAIDADGVALSAIQGLLERVESQQQRIEALEEALAAREGRLARRLARLETMLTGDSLSGAQDESLLASP